MIEQHRFAARQDRHGRVVAVQPLRGKNMRLDPLEQWLQH